MSRNSGKSLEEEMTGALIRNEVEKVRELLNKGVNPHGTRQGYDRNPMPYLTLVNSAEMLSLFLERGVDINQDLGNGLTILAIAVQERSPDFVRFCLDAGADARRGDILTTAAKIRMRERTEANGENMVEIFRMLLTAGAVPPRNLAFHIVAREFTRSYSTPRILALLDENKYDFDVKENGMTLLHYAVMDPANREDTIHFLSERVDVNAAHGQDGRTALMSACQYRHYNAARVLLEKGADVDLQDDAGQTALIYASMDLHPGCIQMLLRAGADPNIPSKQTGTTPLISVVSSVFGTPEQKLTVVRLLVEGPPGGNQNQYRNNKGNFADVNVETLNGVTALSMAVNKKAGPVVSYLLERGADPNYTLPGRMSMLMTAIRLKETQIVEQLLRAGADPLYEVNGQNPVSMLEQMRRGDGGAQVEEMYRMVRAAANERLQAVNQTTRVMGNRSARESFGHSGIPTNVQNRILGFLTRTPYSRPKNNGNTQPSKKRKTRGGRRKKTQRRRRRHPYSRTSRRHTGH